MWGWSKLPPEIPTRTASESCFSKAPKELSLVFQTLSNNI